MLESSAKRRMAAGPVFLAWASIMHCALLAGPCGTAQRIRVLFDIDCPGLGAVSPRVATGEIANAMTVGRTIPRAAREPWPYFGLAFLLAAAGFYPSFFAAIPTLSPAHLIHGFAATAWMLLPLAQGLLIRLRARPLHRAVGWASIGLAALVILSGLKIIQIMAFKNLRTSICAGSSSCCWT